MKIGFFGTLAIKSITYLNDTLTLHIIKNINPSDPDDFPATIYFSNTNSNEEVQITEATFQFHNIKEMWWDRWFTEEYNEQTLSSIKIDNINWRMYYGNELQYNVRNDEFNREDLNKLNLQGWPYALNESFIITDTEVYENGEYYFQLRVYYEIIENDSLIVNGGIPLNVKGKSFSLAFQKAEYDSYM